MKARLFAGLVCLLALSLTGMAQTVTQGSIEGTLLDQSGAAVPAATVAISNRATGVTFNTTSDESGLFRFPVLPIGKYDLKIEKSGFAVVTQKDIVVTVGSKINLTLKMPLAGQSATVTVTGETPLVETTRTSVSGTIADRAIASLPVNGRNFIDYVLLTPGVTRDVRGGDISFAGQRGTLNSLVVDGSDNNNTFFGQTIGRTGSGRAPYQFSQDSVQEFQVNSNSYSAEMGRAGGAVINVVTKSGTNDFHGMGFWYYRDRSMNANDLINKNRVPPLPRSPYHFNQFGANVSGPIARDKAFFFFNYDGQRNTLPNTVFLNLPTTFTPSTTFETAALAYLTARGNSWLRTQDQNAYLGKVDWNINSKNLFTARWNSQRFTGAGFENGGSQNAFEHTGASLVKTDTIAFGLTTTFSPSFINVARGSFVRDQEPGQANSNNPEATVRQTGATVLVVGRNFFSPRETTIKRGQWSDTVTWLHGHHAWKFGADFIVDRIFNFFPGNFSGSYTFASLDDFGRSLTPTVGFPVSSSSTFIQAFGGAGTSGATTKPNIFEYSLFAQDEWRVTPSLIVNYGLRYDYQNTAKPSVSNPAALAGGINTAQLHTDGNNFGPRAGIAWKPFKNDRFVVRAGYGVFYGRTPSIMVGTAHSNNGLNVQTLTFTTATTPAMPNYPSTICGAPVSSPGCAAPGTVVGASPNIFVFAPDYAQPLVQQWSGGFEYEFARDFGVSVSYLGVRGFHLQRTRDRNLLPPTPATISIAGTTTPLTYQKFSTTRPVAGFARIAQFESTANSTYNGLTVQLTKRFSKNYQFLAAYTIGKVTDDKPDATAVVPLGSDDAKIVQNSFDPRSDRGPGDNDQRQRIVLSGVWDLNYANGLSPVGKAFLGGWEVSFIVTAQSGQPYSGAVGADLNTDGNSRSDRTPGQARNFFLLPNTVSVDPRITKNIHLSERWKIQLFGEAFNVFNHANVSNVSATQYTRSTSAAICGVAGTPCLAPSTTFQRPTSTLGPRILQLSAKISF
ncbi:MAG: TonB-dependent receptor [Acidobacteria bacterium]|nr:TonB-dependent receptor [Acidobacteriota bacterium]MBI3662746.1 TonB-dependent receptor [Acidobacteriota bacterium]